MNRYGVITIISGPTTFRTPCDGEGSVVSQLGEAALSPLQSFTYSPCGDLLTTHTYTNGTDFTTESYAYDMLGNRIATTDAHGNTVYRTYDPLGQITAEWGATYPVLYTYDTQGRRTSLTTFRSTGAVALVATEGDTTTWTYDHLAGNCLSKIYADGSTVTYTYTPDNLPLRTTYASGKWKENVYDAQRRLGGVIYSSPDMDYELQLDAYGNTTNVTDAAGNAWRYDYGFNSSLIAEFQIHTGGAQFIAPAVTNSLIRTYDPFDRPSGYALSVNDASKGGIGYAYDAVGHLTHITVTNSADRSFTVVYTNTAGYNYGYTITTPSSNAIRRVVERDAFRRTLVTNCATYFNSSPIESHTYVFDALSRPTARTTGTTGVPPVEASFTYNNRSEVISAAIGTNYFTHVYDDIGNHLLFGDNAVTNTYTHNNLNQITTSLCPPASPRTIHHNADGGLSSDGTWSYAYDAEAPLRSVTSRSLTNGAIRVRNTYDYRRRRISKTMQRLNVTTASPPAPPVELREWETCEERTFVYDDWNLIHETIYTIDGGTTNTTEVQYFWGLDMSDSLQGAGGVGGLLAVSRNSQFYFPSFDNNGNVTKYIDESGNIVAAYEYDDFSRIISQSGPLVVFFRYRFSTKYYDTEIGLYYYGYRFYHPILMQWVNRDPIGENGGVRLYSFCENNAISSIDSLGHAVFLVLAGKDNNEGVFTSQKNVMANSMRTAIKSLALLNSLTEGQYECLKSKNAVRFNDQPFSGTLDEYKKLIEHELNSRVKICHDYGDSLTTVRSMANQVKKPWDYLVYFAHGGNGRRWGVRTMLTFSDGTYDQHAALDEVFRNMTSSVGTKVVISCYQTWDGRGENPLHSETISHKTPHFKFYPSGPNAIINYTTHKVMKGIQ